MYNTLIIALYFQSMNRIHGYFLMPLFAVLFFFTSCINSDYDLNNIDGTSRIAVNDLTIPLNLDKITLDKVIDLGENSLIKEVTDPSSGVQCYAAVESGAFESSSISIPKFSAQIASSQDIESSIDLTKLNATIESQFDAVQQDAINALVASGMTVAQATAQVQAQEASMRITFWNSLKSELEQSGQPLAEYLLNASSTTFETNDASVDKAIRSLDNVTVNSSFRFKFSIKDLLPIIKNIRIYGLKLQLPKGLTISANGGVYDKATGILDMTGNNNSPVIIDGQDYDLIINVTAINLAQAGADLKVKENAAGSFSFNGTIGIASGKIKLYYSDFVDGKTLFDLPAQANYTCQTNMTDIAVTSMTGKIQYAVTGINIDPILISDLPEFLDGAQTNVSINNPQLYLNINNPLSNDKVVFETGLSVYGERDGVKRPVKSLDDGKIDFKDAQNLYCISPSKPSKYYTGYELSTPEGFQGLKDILSGNGFPPKINVEIVNPGVPEQLVTGFKLGQNIAPVKGDYTFYAPLALESGSIIVYEKTVDGWDDESVDNMTITKLKVTATLDSDIPLNATVSIYPIDKQGKIIPGIEFNNAELKSNQADQEFLFEQKTGEITKLGGFILRATIVADDAVKTLSPVQSITVRNLKGTVSGYYQDKF